MFRGLVFLIEFPNCQNMEELFLKILYIHLLNIHHVQWNLKVALLVQMKKDQMVKVQKEDKLIQLILKMNLQCLSFLSHFCCTVPQSTFIKKRIQPDK